MITRTIALISGFLAVILLSTMASVAQDTKVRTAKTLKAYRNQAVEVVGKELGSQRFVNDKLDANREWLKNLSVEFRNTSRKTITYMLVNFYIEKQGDMKAMVAIPVQYHTGLDGQDKGLGPGKTIKLKIEPKQYIWAMNEVAKTGVSDITAIKLDVRKVSFSDGTRWHVGFDLDPKADVPRPLATKSPLLSFFWNHD